MTQRIAYDGAQEKPKKQQPQTNQGEERAEPKKEFYDCKNVREKCQNQAFYSFAFD